MTNRALWSALVVALLLGVVLLCCCWPGSQSFEPKRSVAPEDVVLDEYLISDPEATGPVRSGLPLATANSHSTRRLRVFLDERPFSDRELRLFNEDFDVFVRTNAQGYVELDWNGGYSNDLTVRTPLAGDIALHLDKNLLSRVDLHSLAPWVVYLHDLDGTEVANVKVKLDDDLGWRTSSLKGEVCCQRGVTTASVKVPELSTGLKEDHFSWPRGTFVRLDGHEGILGVDGKRLVITDRDPGIVSYFALIGFRRGSELQSVTYSNLYAGSQFFVMPSEGTLEVVLAPSGSRKLGISHFAAFDLGQCDHDLQIGRPNRVSYSEIELVDGKGTSLAEFLVFARSAGENEIWNSTRDDEFEADCARGMLERCRILRGSSIHLARLPGLVYLIMTPAGWEELSSEDLDSSGHLRVRVQQSPGYYFGRFSRTVASDQHFVVTCGNEDYPAYVDPRNARFYCFGIGGTGELRLSSSDRPIATIRAGIDNLVDPDAK